MKRILQAASIGLMLGMLSACCVDDRYYYSASHYYYTDNYPYYYGNVNVTNYFDEVDY